MRAQVAGGWVAVQGDPMDLGRLGERFDVVILDRCIAFQPDPAAALRGALEALDGRGLVIVTGMAIHADPRPVRHRLDLEREAFRARFGMDLLLRPADGVLDRSHLRDLARLDLVVRDHPFLRMANVRARFDHSRPRHRYGTVVRA